MKNFIDLDGVSGASYRFQQVVDLARLPAMAGNFVYVRGRGASRKIVCCGAHDTLLTAAEKWEFATLLHGVEELYVRLNVSWKIRAYEHDDIVKRHKPSMILAEDFERPV